MDEDDARRIAEAELAQWNGTLTPNRLVNPSATSRDLEDEWVVTESNRTRGLMSFTSQPVGWVRTSENVNERVDSSKMRA